MHILLFSSAASSVTSRGCFLTSTYMPACMHIHRDTQTHTHTSFFSSKKFKPGQQKNFDMEISSKVCDSFLFHPPTFLISWRNPSGDQYDVCWWRSICHHPCKGWKVLVYRSHSIVLTFILYSFQNLKEVKLSLNITRNRKILLGRLTLCILCPGNGILGNLVYM